MKKICARKCDECLYSNKRIVSDARAKEIMRKVAREDGYFLCHKGTIRGEEVICAGSYQGNLVRVLGRIGGLKKVDPDTGLEVPKDTDPSQDFEDCDWDAVNELVWSGWSEEDAIAEVAETLRLSRDGSA